MTKRILLGMHNLSERARYEKILSRDGEVLVSDVSRGLSGLLDDIYRIRPDEIYMEVNYPISNAKSMASLRRASRFMIELGYDISKTLFAITENEKLIKKVSEESFNVFRR